MNWRFWSKDNTKEEYNVTDEFIEYLEFYPESTAKSYVIRRVLEQIKWYDKQAIKSQAHFRLYSTIVLIISASIPVVTLLIPAPNSCGFLPSILKIAPTILSALVLVFSSLASQERHQSLWVSYRTNCEILKSVLHRFFTKTKEFSKLSDEEALEMLVSECEEYIIKEFQTWTKGNEPKSENQKSTSSMAS